LAFEGDTENIKRGISDIYCVIIFIIITTATTANSSMEINIPLFCPSAIFTLSDSIITDINSS
jgi:hypothetical protein